MRFFGILCLLVLLTGTALADLNQLLKWQQVGDSGAFVSSGFHDWRTVSKYRRNPGLHAGYDIAMLAGSEVRTPWPGVVTAVTPWYGEEVGVTLQLSDGFEVTFGHLVASVAPGRRLAAGEVVGRVVVDHVDVKMRDGLGRPFDFGESPLVLQPETAPPAMQDLKAEYQAFAEQLERVARLQYQVGLGLATRRSLDEAVERLERLRPLALRHAQRSGSNLPKKPAFGGPAQNARPVTDRLLGL